MRLATFYIGYVNPDQSDDVTTANVPHVMYYAPNVSDKDVAAATPTLEQFHHFTEHGRWPETPYPILILRSPHGCLIRFRGVEERNAITKQYEGMLGQLCKIKDVWCLTVYGRQETWEDSPPGWPQGTLWTHCVLMDVPGLNGLA